MNRISKLITVTGAVAALVAPSAFGHAEVTKYSPKRGSTVPNSLRTVSIKLSEAVLGGSLKVYNSKGKLVSTNSRLASKKTLMRATVSRLKSGRYTAKAAWIADDGDKQTKNWTFRVSG
jgi:methionine-rich copper-binding protein CopC